VRLFNLFQQVWMIFPEFIRGNGALSTPIHLENSGESESNILKYLVWLFNLFQQV
jgi:hypothetical protein